jgi:hypothetical protein
MSNLIKDWGFNALALIFFVVALYSLLWTKAAANATVALIAGVFCALMGNPDRFQIMKFAPLTGIETQARAAVQQVQVSLEQLQKLAATLAEGSLNDLAFSGNIFTGMSTAQKFRIRDQIVERLLDIGVTRDGILKAQELWILVYCNILEGQIEEAVHQSLPNTDVKHEVIQVVKGNGRDGLPLPEALRKWVITKGLSDPKINERLNEYERVWTTGAIHNPDLIPFGSIPRATVPDEH